MVVSGWANEFLFGFCYWRDVKSELELSLQGKKEREN